jgi:hypothetical protein
LVLALTRMELGEFALKVGPEVKDGAGVIAMLKAWVAFPFASVTWTVKLYEPPPVGVPEITPVEELIERPEGKPLEIEKEGDAQPEVATVWEYETVTAPPGRLVVLIEHTPANWLSDPPADCCAPQTITQRLNANVTVLVIANAERLCNRIETPRVAGNALGGVCVSARYDAPLCAVAKSNGAPTSKHGS